MNALAVQNPHHKCDLGNKNDSPVTDKKITISQSNLLIELINEESSRPIFTVNLEFLQYQ